MGRAVARNLRFAWVLAGLLACASPAPTPERTQIPAHELRERHRELQVGQARDEVRERMGALPVQRPGHPDAPFPTPYRATEWRTPAGDRVRLEVYVVAVRPADGCPDVQYEDAPVAYRNDRVVALSWDELEWRWRAWGGELGVLRSLQDRFVCERPPAPGQPNETGEPTDPAAPTDPATPDPQGTLEPPGRLAGVAAPPQPSDPTGPTGPTGPKLDVPARHLPGAFLYSRAFRASGPPCIPPTPPRDPSWRSNSCAARSA